MKKYLGLFILAITFQSCMLGRYPQGSGGYDDSKSGGGSQNPNGGRQQNPPDDQYPNDRGGSTNQGKTQSGRSANDNITVGNIRLTDQYTIIYLTFTNDSKPGNYIDKNGQKQYSDGSNNIAWSSISELIAANGARTFRFVKVEGLPVVRPGEDLDRKGYKLPSGKSINFVVYFDRLDKGLENFDLFECQSDGYTCWNIYDLYVKNPADNIPTPTQNPTPPVDNTPTKTRTKTGKVGEVDNTPPPAPVVTNVNVGGIVRDVKTNRPISATIDYKLSSSKQVIDSVQSFSSTGLYRMTLPKGQVYTLTTSARGYLSSNDVLDLSRTSGGQKVTKDIYLTPIAVGDKIVLKNIYFEVSKSDLLPASYAELNKLVSMMQDNPMMVIRLEGHTDVVGDPEANLELSQDRVDACQAYLVKQGIQSARIEAKGFGDTRPIVKKGTDEERKVNRRVEFVVLKL
jgi:OmpA-OmpF porin, OOP family